MRRWEQEIHEREEPLAIGQVPGAELLPDDVDGLAYELNSDAFVFDTAMAPAMRMPWHAAGDDDGMSYELYGEALALGEDTFASVETSSEIISCGHFTVAKGYVRAKAASEGDEDDDVFAEAITGVSVQGADLTIIWTFEQTLEIDGASVDVSFTKFFAIDLPHWDGDTVIVHGPDNEVDIQGDLGPLAYLASIDGFGSLFDIEGNIATIDVEAEALGEDTFVSVDAYALAIEDQLSESAVLVTGAVG